MRALAWFGWTLAMVITVGNLFIFVASFSSMIAYEQTGYMTSTASLARISGFTPGISILGALLSLVGALLLLRYWPARQRAAGWTYLAIGIGLAVAWALTLAAYFALVVILVGAWAVHRHRRRESTGEALDPRKDALCLGCRRLVPKSELLYWRKHDIYCHQECLPRLGFPFGDDPEKGCT